jgi:hypothetical protein
VRLYKQNAVDTQLEIAWFQTLNLKCDILVFQNLLFKFNLYRYTEGATSGWWTP